MALAGGPGRAGTLPSGGKVAAGKATIAKAGPGRMQIRQRSKSAIVNWKGFSIGRGDRVDIDQPSRKAAILNRVTGSTKSSIRGQLSANGKVYLVNPNGVEITRTGRVKAHAFVGSTLDISDRDFRKGKGRFASADAAPAAVRNAGVIEAKSYAALLGGKVENSGTISAELGSVGLGAGRRATLKLSGNFLQVALPPDGDGPLIDSSGTLRGGRVELRAAAAREAARQAVNLSGVVEARSVAKRGGAIVIGGGAGEVAISGRLDASAAHGKGGSVEVTGDRLRLAGATIDASGAAGGGEINLGGGLRGEGPLPRARLTEADAASVISADATRSGDGGSVVVWSDGFTGFAGRITARGGPKGGDGGFAEVSGKRLLSFTGTADLRGARFGTLLLDPSNIVISDDATAGIDVALDGTWFISPDADSANSILNATGLETLLGAANVNVTTENIQFDEAGNITVVAPLAWDTATTLFLDADGAIDFQNTITAPLGTLNAATAGLGAITTTDGAVIEVSSLNFTAQAVAIGGQITTQSGSILSRSDISITGAGVDVGDTLDFNAAASVLLDAPLDGGSVSITAGGGDIDTTAAGAITVDELTLSAGDGIDALGSVAVDGLFLLQSGDWTQNANPLPAFEAGDFQVVEGSATFLRVLGGNGDNIAFQLGDIYGVQGVSGFPNQNFALNNDIDASGTSGWNYYGSNGDSGFAGFEPVLGVDVSGAPIPFTGTFDGGGLTIDGLTITRGDEDQVGLFAALGAGAEVTDLALTNASVFGGYNVGILAGGIDAGASVTGVSVAGTVSSEGGYGYDATVGGLAGANAGSILDSTSSASVDASAYSGEGSGEAIAGGLVGFNQGTITGSSTSGTVTADGGGYYGYATAGGLAGVSTGSILGSTSSSSVDADAFGGSGEAIAGGLVGDSQSTITGSSATGTVAADGGYYGYATAGGLAGVSAASILDSTSSASVTASALGFGDGAGVVAGGLVGDNQSTITGSSATGTVAADGEGGLVLVGGLAGISSDAISGSTAAGAVTATVSGGSIMAGGLVGQTVDVGESAGTIDGSSATGAVQGTSDAGGAVWVGGLVGGSSAAIATSFATGAVSGTLSETGDAESVLAAGGLVGVNISDITDSFATGAVTATGDGDGVGPAVSISAGGLVGGADGGAIERAFANGDVVAQGDDLDASAGGLVGQNSGSVADAFASGDVTSAGGSVGGLVGDNVAAIARTYAIGAVSDGGDGAGGLVGLNNGTVDSSFWDVTTSGTGFSDGGDGLTTAEFQDTAGFFALADAAEWNFEEVWAPSSLGFYPEIYTINPVVRVDPNDADRQYGLANPPFTVAQSFGGPGVYVFGPDGDTAPDYAGTLTSDADATSPIGDYDILASGTVISPLGQAYRVTTLDPGTLAVTPAPLTIAVGDDSKVYGEVYDLGDVGFTVTGLLNDDTVDTVTFASLGAPATAPVGDYDIDVVSVDGQGIGNYVLFPDPPDPGTLAVTPAPLTIAVGDDSKVYGEVYDLGDVDFTVTGLRNNDTVDSVTFASLGAPATAPVGDYDIDVVSIDGQGLGNYVLLPDPPDPGTLTVTPAPLTIAVGDDSKVYGEVYDLGDVGFTVTGLLNDDTVDTVTFASLGAPATAPVGDYDIDVVSVDGQGIGNYVLFPAPPDPGTLTVTPAPLTIAVGDDSKVYGEVYDLGDVGFTVTGLLNDDTVDTVTFASLGSPATAAVGDYDIDVVDVDGQGIDNYVLDPDPPDPGTLSVTLAPLTITADDQVKPFGDRFVFSGDEFSVEGLRNDDRVAAATLTSDGAQSRAAVGDYGIDIGAARGVGLGNYDIEYVPGTFVVEARPGERTNIASLLPRMVFALPNPPDEIVLAFAPGGTAPGGGATPGGRPPEPLAAPAAATGDVLPWLETASVRLEAEAEACRQTLTDAESYLACLGVALDGYAAAIDARLLDLPPALRGVAATIRAASEAVRQAGAAAARRVAAAGSDAEVAAIEREAIETALAAVQAAAREVRASITLLRADEPQLASATEAQGEVIAEALDSVADGLIRAVGL